MSDKQLNLLTCKFSTSKSLKDIQNLNEIVKSNISSMKTKLANNQVKQNEKVSNFESTTIVSFTSTIKNKSAKNTRLNNNKHTSSNKNLTKKVKIVENKSLNKSNKKKEIDEKELEFEKLNKLDNSFNSEKSMNICVKSNSNEKTNYKKKNITKYQKRLKKELSALKVLNRIGINYNSDHISNNKESIDKQFDLLEEILLEKLNKKIHEVNKNLEKKEEINKKNVELLKNKKPKNFKESLSLSKKKNSKKNVNTKKIEITNKRKIVKNKVISNSIKLNMNKDNDNNDKLNFLRTNTKFTVNSSFQSDSKTKSIYNSSINKINIQKYSNTKLLKSMVKLKPNHRSENYLNDTKLFRVNINSKMKEIFTKTIEDKNINEVLKKESNKKIGRSLSNSKSKSSKEKNINNKLLSSKVNVYQSDKQLAIENEQNNENKSFEIDKVKNSTTLCNKKIISKLISKTKDNIESIEKDLNSNNKQYTYETKIKNASNTVRVLKIRIETIKNELRQYNRDYIKTSLNNNILGNNKYSSRTHLSNNRYKRVVEDKGILGIETEEMKFKLSELGNENFIMEKEIKEIGIYNENLMKRISELKYYLSQITVIFILILE